MIRTVEIPMKKNTFGSNHIDIFNQDFKVKINGQEVTCYNSRCSAIPFNRIFDGNQRNINQSELLGHVSFEADEKVTIEVECEKEFSTAVIRPLSKGGSDILENIIICHRDTNEEKGNSFPHWKANYNRYVASRVRGTRNQYIIYEQD